MAAPDKIKRWEYLKPISKVITQMDNIDVGMLIGENCMKALEPMEIISSRNGGPYPHRTKLGWCIVGPITTRRSHGSVKCHRIAVKDVASGKVAPHHFVLDDEPKIEDVGIKEMQEQMYYSDFCECNHLQVNSILNNIEDMSREDRKFLDILETGTKNDGTHYEALLPFRNTGIQLTDNRSQAVKRMHHLKRRFKWKSLYLNVMQRRHHGVMVSSMQVNL